MYMFMTFVNFLAVVLVTFTVLYELPCIKSNNVVSEQASCADPEIFMRGGPTKTVIFGHR